MQTVNCAVISFHVFLILWTNGTVYLVTPSQLGFCTETACLFTVIICRLWKKISQLFNEYWKLHHTHRAHVVVISTPDSNRNYQNAYSNPRYIQTEANRNSIHTRLRPSMQMRQQTCWYNELTATLDQVRLVCLVCIWKYITVEILNRSKSHWHIGAFAWLAR